MNSYQICSRCIMDTTDPEIYFDEDGVCNHCHKFDELKKCYDFADRDKELEKVISRIKKSGKGKEYDCVLGISGGVDSAYMAHLSKVYGLRVLAVHVDCGWNSEVAVNNIKKLCTKLGYDLHTIVVEWEAVKELQRAYMFSGLPNLDVPQDHAFFSATYKYAKKHHIKYILNGSNIATEGILPKSWGYDAKDFIAIKDVYKKCGRGRISLAKYPHLNVCDYLHLAYRNDIKKIDLLNYVDYSKKKAMDLLSKEYDWEYYGGKHFESRFTKFFQSYYLPRKFGYDKKRAHLASLVVGGEMTRDEALTEMNDSSAYSEADMLEDRNFILKKLDISLEEWDKIMSAPCKTEEDYKNYKVLMERFRKTAHFLKTHFRHAA